MVRQQYAFPILYAADAAKQCGYKAVTIIEFGVAGGAGLLNMCRIADARAQPQASSLVFSVSIPEKACRRPSTIAIFQKSFQAGDFPMDVERLKRALPDFAELVIGDIVDTVPEFLDSLSGETPIAFVAVDVDYYSSAKKALRVLTGRPESYLPIVPVYLDDIGVDGSTRGLASCLPWRNSIAKTSSARSRPLPYFAHAASSRTPNGLIGCLPRTFTITL